MSTCRIEHDADSSFGAGSGAVVSAIGPALFSECFRHGTSRGIVGEFSSDFRAKLANDHFAMGPHRPELPWLECHNLRPACHGGPSDPADRISAYGD